MVYDDDVNPWAAPFGFIMVRVPADRHPSGEETFVFARVQATASVSDPSPWDSRDLLAQLQQFFAENGPQCQPCLPVPEDFEPTHGMLADNPPDDQR